MSQNHSKIAIALAKSIINAFPDSGESNDHKFELAASAIDDRLADIREHYKPEQLRFCPVVTHHPEGPCADCICAAMRAFILLPEQLP